VDALDVFYAIAEICYVVCFVLEELGRINIAFRNTIS
jgi:hypothetical protein